MVRTSCLSWWEQVVYHDENKLFIMMRTSCLSWWEQVVYHGENKLFIMMRTSCLSWWEQVVYHGENKLFIMVRTRCLSVRWWCWLCARPTRLVGFLLWTNSLWADMSLQSDTWFWFRTNQSLLQLLTP
jgi:hypothetical protein